MRVDPGPDGRSAKRDFRKLGFRLPEPGDRALDLARVSHELLAQPDGCSVLKVSPACLDDGHELFGFRVEGRAELFERGYEVVVDSNERRDVDGRREAVVGRLAHVDVIVGVNR